METKQDPPSRRIAMLVDGENAQPSLLARMLDETFHYGDVTVRRIYGDWTRPAMGGWKLPLQKLAFHPVQQFHHIAGKNATDCTMIVDAMDIMYSGTVNGFCIGSSDSDFTRLAIRLREQGCFVMGIGSTTTPSVLVNACHVFVPIALLRSPDRQSVVSLGVGRTVHPDLLPLLKGAFTTVGNGSEWIDLSIVGGRLSQLDRQFKPQTYGYRQLSLLIQDHPNLFEVKKTKSNCLVRVREGIDWREADENFLATDGEESLPEFPGDGGPTFAAPPDAGDDISEQFLF